MRIIYIAAAVLICGVVSGPASAQTVTLQIATAAPEASSWVKAMRESAADIKERTQGRVTIKYFTGGIQGSDSQVMRKVRLNILQGGAFTASAFTDFYSDINVYSLPTVFSSYDEANWVRKALDQRLIRGVENAGFVTFGFASTGFAMVMSKDPVRTARDLDKKKVWVPEGDEVSYAAINALGVNPTPLPLTDVLTGLQTNLLDIITVSPVGALFLQWHTKVNYVTRMPLVYTFGFLAVNEQAFNKISSADQEIVREILGEMYSRFDQRGETDNAEAYAALLNSGVEEIVPTEEEMGHIREILAESNRKMAADGVVSKETYDLLLQYRDEYRTSVASQ